MSIQKALIITTSASANSTSTQIAQYAKEQLAKKGVLTTTLDLNTHAPAHINSQALGEFFSQEPLVHAPFAKASDQYIEQLQTHQLVIVATPMYNFSIPSSLKAWIDHVARAGKTFSYTASGPQGHLNHLKALVVRSSGGDYTSEQLAALDHTSSYLQTVFGFLGATNLQPVEIHGTAVQPVAELLEKAKKDIDARLAQI